jgi:hypothetical protein
MQLAPEWTREIRGRQRAGVTHRAAASPGGAWRSRLRAAASARARAARRPGAC